MFKERILSTLRFFDLQDWPPTLLELHTFLIADLDTLRLRLDERWEIINDVSADQNQKLPIDQLMRLLEVDCQAEVENFRGFYYLKGRKRIVNERLQNYLYGIRRERLITRFIRGLRHIPFVRGVALTGSQALGQQKSGSDIDLLIMGEPGFLWLTRTLVTIYFQALGVRRYGQKTANRFCLNHYIAGPKPMDCLKNLYTAFEYAKLRPLIYKNKVAEFQKNNRSWIKAFFPNWQSLSWPVQPQSSIQRWLEERLDGKFGLWLEKRLKNWQLPKIRQEKYIIVKEDELSFHPDSKQQELLIKFFSPSTNFPK